MPLTHRGELATAIRIHFAGIGSEQQIAVGIGQQGAVGGQGARVGVEVFVDAELGGIDENAGNHDIGATLGGLDQGDMAVVQVAHGGHEGDGLARLAGGAQGATQAGNGGFGFHGDFS
jgi:hypothetical protein